MKIQSNKVWFTSKANVSKTIKTYKLNNNEVNT